MRLVHLTRLAVVPTAAAQAFAQAPPCGSSPVINAPAEVSSLSTNNQASFTSTGTPSTVQWSITTGNGTITFHSSSYMLFTAGRGAPAWLQIKLVVSNGNGADVVYKDVRIVHPCLVTPLSRYISMSYAGGTGQIEIRSDCQWDLRMASSDPVSWFRLLTPPGTYSGNQTIAFEFDPLPYGTIPNYIGRNRLVYIGEKDTGSSWRGMPRRHRR